MPVAALVEKEQVFHFDNTSFGFSFSGRPNMLAVLPG